jgi:purine-nucleoside phosphorylase
MCLPDVLEEVNVEEIIATANEAEPKLRQIVRDVLAEEAAARSS